MSAEANLKKLGLALPDMPSPIANYVRFKRAGDMVYLSGQGPRRPDGTNATGKVARAFHGGGLRARQAYGLGLLAAMKLAADGDLDRVEVIKVLGMVNARARLRRPSQGDQRLLGPLRGGARRQGPPCPSAVGMGSLPNGITVEIEAIIRLTDGERRAARSRAFRASW